MSNEERRQEAFDKRVEAAELARCREHPIHTSNCEETRYTDSCDNPTYLASFTKGLPHDNCTGIILNPEHYQLFVSAIETGDPEDFKPIPLGPDITPRSQRFTSGIAKSNDLFQFADVRAWESMGAGHAFDLEGPDAQAVTMPPAPTLDSSELHLEMEELYRMALLRDIPFTQFEDNDEICDCIDFLNNLPWVTIGDQNPEEASDEEKKRFRLFSSQTVFRGNTPGDDQGPYISQFLLAGTSGIANIDSPADGFISYGAMRMDQRVRVATPCRDYMTTWHSFMDVQNGADVRGRETYEEGDGAYRFITTPRDLCTYVHYDALYQAYLNACVILLSMKMPFDEGLPFQKDDDIDKQQAFAHFGPPHILTLVTEVATRALKAVRFQKYNMHRRARPEAIAGLIERYHKDPENELYEGVSKLYNNMDTSLLCQVVAHNAAQNELEDFGRARADDWWPEEDGGEGGSRLLPMAFAEGSPMHPSYGAGHATVAGAAVTVLKAFFDCDAVLPFVFVTDEGGSCLRDLKEEMDIELTVGGELNKLCSNISIGRNWAGVHWFSDYRESILMGEKVALGILEEQKLMFKEEFSMTVPLFDGSAVTI